MKIGKLRVFLAGLILMAAPIQMVQAASVTFTNFSYTTKPYQEGWAQVAAKTKTDDEQNWYATITSSFGLYDPNRIKVYLNSNTRNSSISTVSASVPLKESTKSIKQPYSVWTPGGTNCRLYIHGDENASISYVVNISGRYTS